MAATQQTAQEINGVGSQEENYFKNMALKRIELISALSKSYGFSLEPQDVAKLSIASFNKGLTQRLELPKHIITAEDKIVSEFNTKIFRLLQILEKRRPNDSNISRLKKLMSAAKSVQHKVLIEVAGTHLFLHGAKIISRTALSITVDVIDQTVKKGTVTIDNNEDAKNLQLAKELFVAAKSEAEKMTPEEREKIYVIIEEMIYSYLQFTHFKNLQNYLDNLTEDTSQTSSRVD